MRSRNFRPHADNFGLEKTKISSSDVKVSLGHLLKVLAVLGLEDGLNQIASDDEIGRKLQDAGLLGKH